MANTSNTISDNLSKLEVEIDKFVNGSKVPSLSDNTKELIVKISPWFAVVSMVLLLPLVLAAFGISAFLLPFSFLAGMHSGFGFSLDMLFSLGMIILELMAIPGLFKREQKAWRLMFYSTLLSLTQQLISFNLGALVLGGAISLYFLFQVKAKYNK